MDRLVMKRIGNDLWKKSLAFKAECGEGKGDYTRKEIKRAGVTRDNALSRTKWKNRIKKIALPTKASLINYKYLTR